MNKLKRLIRDKKGGIGFDVILWLIGVPLPVIILISLLRGCQ